MKKNIDKFLKQSIETYVFLLIIIFIIKLLGGNYFAISFNNKQLVIISDFITKYKLENIWYAITLYINIYITMAITCSDNSNKMKKYSLKILPIAILLQILKTIYNNPFLFVLIDLIYLFICSAIYLKGKISKTNILNYIVYMVLLNIVQLISIFTRCVTITNKNNFFTYCILNIDFILMLIIIYKYYFMKGGVSLWAEVVSFGSQKLILLKTLLKKLPIKYQKKNKKEKIENAIYIPLYILWNLFTMLIIILIATLNNAFIEAIFITLSFWINKRVFGRPFHFKSVAMCFCFSSLVYYVLTRITFKIENSIFVPIILGVALSYVTSYMAKSKTEKKLYRGMPENDFYELINKVTDNKLVIQMCKEFYCDREKEFVIANRYNYCIESLQKKKKKINDLIKELNN